MRRLITCAAIVMTCPVTVHAAQNGSAVRGVAPWETVTEGGETCDDEEQRRTVQCAHTQDRTTTDETVAELKIPGK